MCSSHSNTQQSQEQNVTKGQKNVWTQKLLLPSPKGFLANPRSKHHVNPHMNRPPQPSCAAPPPRLRVLWGAAAVAFHKPPGDVPSAKCWKAPGTGHTQGFPPHEGGAQREKHSFWCSNENPRKPMKSSRHMDQTKVLHVTERLDPQKKQAIRCKKYRRGGQHSPLRTATKKPSVTGEFAQQPYTRVRRRSAWSRGASGTSKGSPSWWPQLS